jgi:hypothetical protein
VFDSLLTRKPPTGEHRSGATTPNAYRKALSMNILPRIRARHAVRKAHRRAVDDLLAAMDESSYLDRLDAAVCERILDAILEEAPVQRSESA